MKQIGTKAERKREASSCTCWFGAEHAMDFSNNSSSVSEPHDQKSTSLTIGERLCAAAFMPLTAIIEALIFVFGDCFDYRPRLPNTSCYLRLAHETPFTVNEVEALHELYNKLSNLIIKDGLIHKEELQLAMFRSPNTKNLLLDRVFYLFDEKKIGALGFEEFIHALSVFHPHAPTEEKIDFVFKLYDPRQTGFIERQEVKQVATAILQESDVKLPDEYLEDIVDKTFADVDADKDGKINKEEWKAFVIQHPNLLKNMTVPYLKNMTSTLFPSFIFDNEIED